MQKQEDFSGGILKRDRTELSPSFIDAYNREILSAFDEELDQFADSLQDVESMVFFCVEEYPEACHRSIVAARVADYFGVEVEDLRHAMPDCFQN